MMNGMNPMQIIGMLQGQANPMQAMMSMFGNNPQMQNILNMMQGKSPQEMEKMVRQAYQNKGMDINSMMSQLQQMGIKF